MFYDTFLMEPVRNLLMLVFSIIATVVVLKVSSVIIRRHFEGKKDKAQVKEMVSIYQYSFIILVVFVMVIVFSNLFKNVLASIGILAAGLAVALQRPILNLFGWMTIVMKRPYAIGDRVCIGSSKGDVFDINIMHTSMSELQEDAPSGRMITVPNEFVLTQPITNYTKGTPYVWDTLSVTVEKGSDEKKAARIVRKATDRVVGSLMSDLSKKWTVVDGRKVDVKPEISVELVVVNGSSAIQLTSRYLCNVHEKKSVRSRITELLLDFLKHSNGVKLK